MGSAAVDPAGKRALAALGAAVIAAGTLRIGYAQLLGRGEAFRAREPSEEARFGALRDELARALPSASAPLAYRESDDLDRSGMPRRLAQLNDALAPRLVFPDDGAEARLLLVQFPPPAAGDPPHAWGATREPEVGDARERLVLRPLRALVLWRSADGLVLAVASPAGTDAGTPR